MGIYKQCKHRGRQRDRCRHAWWGSLYSSGKSHRVSLSKWSGQTIESKQAAQVVFDKFKESVRSGDGGTRSDITFAEFADVYIERHVRLRGLRSIDLVGYRLKKLQTRFANRRLADIKVRDIEDLIEDLKADGKKPATINRHLALLRHMFNWAVDREYLERTPFRRGVIRLERENNQRKRRLLEGEEGRLLAAAGPMTRALVIGALDTGMRKNELLTLRVRDVDIKNQLVRVRSENAKSKRRRQVPISTTRLKAMLEWLLTDCFGETKSPDAFVFSEDGTPTRGFRTGWEDARRRAGCHDLWFHDLRGEYASRLVERDVPLSQVRDLLGHSSITTTERYDRQHFENLRAAAQQLDDEDGQIVIKFSYSAGAPKADSSRK